VLIVVSATKANRTKKVRQKNGRSLFFCLTFFCPQGLMAETTIKAARSSAFAIIAGCRLEESRVKLLLCPRLRHWPVQASSNPVEFFLVISLAL